MKIDSGTQMNTGRELNMGIISSIKHLFSSKPSDNPTTRTLSLPKGCDFIAVDLETATGNMDSACEIGIALVSNLRVIGRYNSLIQPPNNYYWSKNSSIHGISSGDTENEKTFSEVWRDIKRLFGPVPVVAHNARFDMSVLRSCIKDENYSDFAYVDTLKMVRDIVPGRHGLAPCCNYFGISLKDHHRAGDDAVACAEVAIACIKTSGYSSLRDYCVYEGIPVSLFSETSVSQPKWATFPKRVRISDIHPTVDLIDESNPLFGKNIVFTGELSVDRVTAMQIAVNEGAILRSKVTNETDFLVVGMHNPVLVGEKGISTKEKKALELIASGLTTLKIITGEQFAELVTQAATK